MWKDEIKKYSKKNYHPIYSKSKFWGDMDNIPNELDDYVNHIVKMTEKEISDVEVQKDIEYIKKLCKKHIEELQGHLDKLDML